MQGNDTSNDDVPIIPDPNIDLVSSLRKENLYLQTKIFKMNTELQNFLSLNEKYQNLTEKLKYANDKIADLKYRLQISINQNQENQKQILTERTMQNQVCTCEINKLKNNMKQLLKNKNDLLEENNKLREKINLLTHTNDIALSVTKNQNDILLSSAKSYFHMNFSTIIELKEYLLNNSLPPIILPEKDKVIQSQQTLMDELKKKNKSMKKEYDASLNQKNLEIISLNQEIHNQQIIINDLNLQIKQKIDFFTNKIEKIKKKVPKKKNLHKYTSSTITIIPDPNIILNLKKENEEKSSYRLIDKLNEKILELQKESAKNQNDFINFQIQFQKLKTENDSKQNELSNYSTRLKSLKKKYQLKLKVAYDKIKELQISNKVPDPIAENLIASAKSKLRYQRESIIFKDSQLSKLTDEINRLQLLNSKLKAENAHLKSELTKQSENSFSQLFAESLQNSISLPQDQQNKMQKSNFIFNYSDINPKLKSILKPIVESTSLSIESKLQISIKKIDSYYMLKLEKKKKYKEINFSIENFISEILKLTINCHSNIETLSKNSELQSQVIESLKENKRIIEHLQCNTLNQKNEILFLKKKLTRNKEKLTSSSILHKNMESLKSEYENLVCENNKLKTENADYERKISILKNENAELYNIIEYEKNRIIQMMKDQTISQSEYEELLKKIQKKCYDQQITIKCLSGCNC